MTEEEFRTSVMSDLKVLKHNAETLTESVQKLGSDTHDHGLQLVAISERQRVQHDEIESIKGSFRWVTRLVVGAVILALLGLVLAQTSA